MEQYRIADIELAPSGRLKMDWAKQYMPVLELIGQKYEKEQPLQGITVASCLHLEAKTACLLETMHRLGAVVSVAGSNPLSTQDDICAAIATSGIHVFSRRGMSAEEYSQNLRLCLEWNPSVLIDDGGDMVTMIHDERQDLIPGLRGGCEETTTGIKRLRAMHNDGCLKFPMLAVNDANSKHMFDNRYGTGQSVFDAIMRTTNLLVAGKTVVVAGYGWCGKGVSMRARGMGASVVVVEIDPHKAIEALMDGHSVMNMDDAARVGDIFVTVTGNTKVIRKQHFEVMKNGAILANAGHFDVEVYIPDMAELAASVHDSRPNVRTYTMKDGRALHLLGEGRLVNLAAGDGHPVEIMDMSFAMQLLSCLYLCRNKLTPGLYEVPKELDTLVASLKIESLGIKLEVLTEEQEKYLESWRE